MDQRVLETLSADLCQRAAGIRLAAFDVDGTLTDGKLHYGHQGREWKAFHVHDGLGLKLLLDHGIAVALVTARTSAAVAERAAELGIALLHQGVADKRECLLNLCRQCGVPVERAAFMGDDAPDLPALSIAGLSAAPADAQAWVAERVHWRSRHAGGHGAVREFCDLLLAAGGHADAALARFLPR